MQGVNYHPQLLGAIQTSEHEGKKTIASMTSDTRLVCDGGKISSTRISLGSPPLAAAQIWPDRVKVLAEMTIILFYYATKKYAESQLYSQILYCRVKQERPLLPYSTGSPRSPLTPGPAWPCASEPWWYPVVPLVS
jgi:hypothetical protein